MENPVRTIEHRSQRLGQFLAVAFRGEQERPGAAAPDLDEKGPVIIAVARGAFGINRERPSTRLQLRGRSDKLCWGG